MNIIGNNIIELDEIDSTNNYASALLLNDKQPDGTIVLARYQSNGKGQGDNKWHSVKDANILMSVVLKHLDIDVLDQFCISEMAALSILDTVKEKYDLNLKIKWPNDIYFESKKLAGILIKNSIGENIVKNSIIGIGINVNQDNFLPDVPNATSLSLILNNKIDKEGFFYSLIQNLNDNYLRLLSRDYSYLKKKYEEYLLGLDKEIEFVGKSVSRFKGIIKGIEKSGELKIKVRDKIKSFKHGEIKFECLV